MRRRMHPDVGDLVEPVPPLLIEVRIIGKRAAVDEIVTEIADRPLDFALGLGAIRPARARREAPVVREAEKLKIADERATLLYCRERFVIDSFEQIGTDPNFPA